LIRCDEQRTALAAQHRFGFDCPIARYVTVTNLRVRL